MNKFVILPILFFFIIISSASAISQREGNSDTSATHIRKLTRLKTYYLNQVRKSNVSEKYRTKYKDALDKTNKELDAILDVKRKAIEQSPDSSNSEKFRNDSLDREAGFDIISSFAPKAYSHEMGSSIAGFSVSFLQSKFSSPVNIYYEKPIAEKFSVGMFVGRFVEQNRKFVSFDPSHDFNSDDYRYKYINFGAKGLWHFMNPAKPLFGLDISKFDIYLCGYVGYNISMGAKPYLIKNIQVNEPPMKDGLTYGFFPGIRYFPDEHAGIFLEAGYSRTGFVNVGVALRFFKSEDIVKKAEAEEDAKREKAKDKKGGSKYSKGKKKK